MDSDLRRKSLKYHESFPPGKINIGLPKPVKTQEDLTLSYTPGVGTVSDEIAKNKDEVWKYTNRGNTVAIISDGTAVLGLGNIGPEAALPVMEGKAVLFKKFADIDAYPLCVNFDYSKNREEYLENFITMVRSLEPTLGGINLEDVKAPLCFELQSALEDLMDIPVFHDDQNGTAVIIYASLLNALKITGKDLQNIKLVINGAGAAGISCARLIHKQGMPKEHIFICDSKGLITTKREDLNIYKREFAQDSENMELGGAIKDADVFIGVSAPNVLTKEMVKSMNEDPIVFAVANPVPEIMPEDAIEAGARIVGTGRSDFPNQVNNALGFPGLFRGTLDTRASTINHPMKIAAAEALASLANESVRGTVKEILETAYPEEAGKGLFSSGNPLNEKYIIPKQFDLRVVPRIAREVAKAAMDSGVARMTISDLDAYEKSIFDRIISYWK